MSVSAINANSQNSIFQKDANNVLKTTYKVIDFVKENFLNIAAISLIITSGFVFSSTIAIEAFGAFVVLKVIAKIFTLIFRPIEKIKTAPFPKKNVINIHDSRAWLKTFRSADFHKKKAMLKSIGRQTLTSVRRLGFQGVINLSLSDIDNMKRNTEIVGRNIRSKKDENTYFQAAKQKNKNAAKFIPQKVEILEGDSFDVALHLKHKKGYKNVAVLNMANATSPGGGFLTGCAAQEESLCRRSTLFDAININNPQKGNANPYLRRKMGGNYQVPELGALYTPSVKVFRGNVDEGFAYYTKPGDVNVISSAAYDLKHNPRSAKYRENTKMKLQMILNSALETNQELVVLGAYGCGAFDNDPKEITEIVKEILTERPVYQQKMKIVFAIITDKNDTKGNIKGFSPLHNFIS